MISLLCPTRGRPEQFQRMVESAAKTALGKINVFVCIQTDEDVKRYSFLEMNKSNNIYWSENIIVYPFLMLDCPTVALWNELAECTCNRRIMLDKDVRLFMLAADDMIFATPGWDKALIDHYNALGNKIHVYAFQDSRDHEGTPHPIVTREYMDAMGYFVPPIFLHWFIDSWTIAIARANNCFTHLKDHLLIHDKPSDRGEADETHKRIRRMGWHERDKYVNDTCQHFLEFEKQRLAKFFK